MTGWLIYDKKQFEKNRWFAKELLKNCSAFSEMRLILAEKLIFGSDEKGTFFEYEGKALSAPDFAVNRAIFPLLTLCLEKSKTRVFNSYETCAVCNDKRKAYLSVAGSRVPTAKTAFFKKSFFDLEAAKNFGFPSVLKSSDSHGGNEVFLLKSEEELEETLPLLACEGFLLQKPLSNAGDLRVYVLGKEILGAVLRTPKEGSFKSNFSLGGSVQSFDVNAELLSAVKEVLRLLPCTPDFIGIDFLYDGKSFLFNEAEDVVGTRMLYKTSKIDAAKEFSRYIESEMKTD